jgi:hypothetical protein
VGDSDFVGVCVCVCVCTVLVWLVNLTVAAAVCVIAAPELPVTFVELDLSPLLCLCCGTVSGCQWVPVGEAQVRRRSYNWCSCRDSAAPLLRAGRIL